MTAREWKAIECIQTCIKAHFGIGVHLPMHFSMQVDVDQQKKMMSQLNLLNVKTDLDYDFGGIGEEYKEIIIEEGNKLMLTMTRAQV